MPQAVTYRRPPGLSGVELLRLEDPNFGFAPHIHDAYVFWLNGRGGERVSLGGASGILQPDSFGVVAPGEVHANHPVTASRTLQSFYVDAAVIETMAERNGGRCAGFRSRLQRDPAARSELASLHAVLLRTPDPFEAAERFQLAFIRLMERHGEGTARSVPGRDPEKVRLARRIMDEQWQGTLTVEALADLCGCSPAHLIRLFKRETGMTPHAYLMERRLARARTGLAGEAPIADVAAACGFADQAHLNRRFAARFGLTPARYRSQMRG
ncbi:MAG: helix-turn-helix domain-containing protein [Pseudodesulfovibrio sp.]|uniref:helix-turn-helix domain-containing protein n=1 Tax=Pseudodesulfovibrio sp. TaxID=2035812 RepID=UPI003D0BC7F8